MQNEIKKRVEARKKGKKRVYDTTVVPMIKVSILLSYFSMNFSFSHSASKIACMS